MKITLNSVYGAGHLYNSRLRKEQKHHKQENNDSHTKLSSIIRLPLLLTVAANALSTSSAKAKAAMLKNMVEAVETFHPIKGEKNRIEKGKSYGTSINFEDAPAVQ